MAIGLGSFTPSKLYLGVTEVSKAYLGASVAYEVGGGAWTPAELGASLALWLDADDASTITLNGSTVSQWDDKSGNSRHVTQSTSANQPSYTTRTLDGKQVVEFSGNQMLFSTATVLSGNPDVLMAVVVQFDINIAAGDRSLQLGPGQGTSYVISGGSDGYSSRFNNGNEIYGPASLATPLIQIGTRPAGGDYASSQMFIDGIESARTSGNNDVAVPNIDTGVSVGAGASSSNSFGSVHRPMDGYVAEAMIVGDITLATRQKLEGYLAWKWGLEANLPAGHPYKSTPPTV